MREYDLAGKAEADAGTLRLCGKEGEEDILPQGFRNARAVVCDLVCVRRPLVIAKDSDTAGCSEWVRAASAALRRRLIRTWQSRSGSASSINCSGVTVMVKSRR